MKFSVSTGDMNYALSMCLRAVTARPVKQIYEGVLIEAQDQGLILTATDGEITVRTRIAAAVEEEGRTLLPAKLFGDLMRYQPDGEVMINVDERGRAQIKSRGTSSSMVSMDGDDFPDIDEIQGGTEVRLNCARLKDAVSKVMFSVSTDESRKILTGVLMEVYPHETILVGLDGFRLAIQRIEQDNSLPEKSPEKLSSVIPGKIMNEIGRMLPDDSDAEALLTFTAGRMTVSFGPVMVYASLLTGEFIDYHKILPKNWTTEISLSRDQLSNAIDRCSLMAREGKNNLIHFSIRSDGILEMTANAERGEVVDQMEIHFEGNELNIAFNSKYLIDVIHNISTERISMCFNTNVSPCIIKPEEGKEYLFLVLPVRIFGR